MIPRGPGRTGMAIRFHLAAHEHTDIVAHSHEGFPVHTPGEFLEFIRAAAASGPNAPAPPPIAAFLATHPAALAFVTAPKPIPASFARQAYFAVTAFQFINSSGASRFGRFRIRPEGGTDFLSAEQAAKKPAEFLDAELTERLAKGQAQFKIFVQLAEPGDVVNDATVNWPATRSEVEFGTIALTGMLDAAAAEQKKIIFDPLPRVDGIDSAGDPLTAVRADVYLLSGRRRRQAAKWIAFTSPDRLSTPRTASRRGGLSASWRCRRDRRSCCGISRCRSRQRAPRSTSSRL